LFARVTALERVLHSNVFSRSRPSGHHADARPVRVPAPWPTHPDRGGRM